MIKLPKDIEYIITDFDGVMTDGCVYVTDNVELSKKLNFKDIMGISLAIKAGYKVGIVSGETCGGIDYVAEKFKLEEVHCKIRKKLEVIQGIVERNKLNPEKVVYIGDDVNDLEALNYVGYPITVNNAVEMVKAIPNIQITEKDGGNGAFREIIDALIY